MRTAARRATGTAQGAATLTENDAGTGVDTGSEAAPVLVPETGLQLSVAAAMMDDVPTRHPTTSPFLGRGDELDTLAELVGVGVGGGSGIVLVAGDAGVGKTRLLNELREVAHASGSRTVVGHCLDFGDSALPYLPFTEILGRLAQDAPELVAESAAAHPAVRHLLPGHRIMAGPLAGESDNVDRSALFEAVHSVLEQLAESGPVLVLLEDLHWADKSTRDLLTFLFMRRFSGPVAVVATYRSDDLNRRHPLRAVAAQWARIPGVHRLQLGPLGDEAVRSMVRSLSTRPLSASAVETIVERAEGNAFFAEELVVATEIGGGSLPDDLATLLLVRLDQLDDAARQVVRAASCAGRRVSHELLAAVAGLPGPALEQALRDAVECNVLVPTGASYAFRHALLAEAVYDDLLPGERVRLHAAYVTAFVDQAVDGTAAELARHARAAHDLSTAVRASIEAGDEAMTVGGPEDAARHYQLALELLGEPGDRPADLDGVDVVSLTVRAGDAVTASGNHHRAVALVRDQLDRLPADAPDEDRIRLLVSLGRAALMADTDVNALEVTRQALDLVGPEPTPLRARVLTVHAHASSDWQRLDDAARRASEAVDLGERLGLPDVVADATTTLARLEERLGDPEESRRTLEKVVEQARADGDLVTELRGLHHLGALLFEAGQLDEASLVYADAATRAAQNGRPWAPYGLDSRLMAANTAYVAGRWDDVLRIIDVTGQSPPATTEALLAAVGLGVAAGRGDAAGIAGLERVVPYWHKDGLVTVLSGTAGIDLHGDAGDLRAAIAFHDDACASIMTRWQVGSFLAQIRFSGLLIGQLAQHVAAVPPAERASLVRRGEELLAVAEEAVARAESRRRMIGPEGRAWLRRAEAELLRLRWSAGIDSPDEERLLGAWEAAVAAFVEFGHVFEIARSRARLAAVLRSAGRSAEARVQTDLARETARRLGARPLLDELRLLGSAPRRQERDDRRRDDALTPREHEILVLVAQGRTNSEIARQLFISAKTVSVHVSNILAKLGAGGRTEAAALARRQGLLTD